MRLHRLKRWLLGTPLPTAQARHERLGKAAGLAIFASDPLSSNAYATEEILHVLGRKLEADPARPRYLLTEPGVGYRLAAD